MKYAAFTELTTPRLLLRKLQESDLEDFYRFSSDPCVSKYMLWKPHQTIDESAKSIKTSIQKYESGKFYRWGIALKDSNILIGMIQLLRFDEVDNSCSFAYMLNKDHWNKGFGTEALSAVLRYAFEEMQMETIEADHMSDNAASGMAMKKCGMIFTKTVTGKYEKDGVLYDADSYVITREQWARNE